MLLTEIKVGNRFRKDYDIDPLMKSIEEHGILEPLVIDDDNNLLAGGRRFLAAQKLGLTDVPVHCVSALTDLQRRIIELEENIQRKDMEWHEKVALVGEIDELKKAQFGENRGARDTDKWSTRKTAGILGESVGKVSEDIQLHEMLKEFPQLKDLPNKGAAKRIAKQLKEEAALKRGIDKGIFDVSDYDALYKISDIIDFLPHVDLSGVSFCNVDPPYGISLPEIKSKNNNITAANYKELSVENYVAVVMFVGKILFERLPANANIVWWYGAEHYEVTRRILSDIGFGVDIIPCLWTKPNGQTNNPRYCLARCYETFLYVRKVNGEIIKPGRSNIFDFAPVPPQTKYHPTQKPVELMTEIYETFAGPGKIFSPFLGSGTDIIAALKMGRYCFGCDISEEYKMQYLKRVITEVKYGQTKKDS